MKTFTRKPLSIAIAIAIGSLLGGCNSSSTSSDSPITSESAALEGTFVDSPVNGLTFRGDFNGVTADGGKYRFKENGMVKFSIGDKIVLGTLKGSTFNVTPLDFFEGADVNDPRVISILILLQSLDEDNDRGNGINISNNAIAELEKALEDRDLLDAIDFSAMTVEEARDFIDNTLIPLLNDVINNTPEDDGVVSEDDAVEHFTFTTIGGDITLHKNISRTPGAGSGGHSVTSMKLQTTQYHASGEASEEAGLVRPILVSYTDIVTGDFQMGTGSSEIPDIEHVADTFVALSLDKGVSWKPINISNTADKNSAEVDFWGDGEKLPYYGHSFKPVIKTEGKNVLVAWNDKYCPSGNPSGFLDADSEDLYLVNGPQLTINYEGVETYGDETVPAHEVPFSCVWTARGIFNEENHEIDWHAPIQLTSGRRDSNKITIASSEEGFVMAWQEDVEGLRPGGGAGPGEGWSGASTNHRSDIWYSYIPLKDEGGADYFAATEVAEDETVKPKSLNNLSSPVPVSDNAVCQSDNVDSGTGALYCASMCENGSFTASEGEDDRDNGKCYSDYIDPIRAIYNDTPDITEQQLLNGDTGSSRPILAIFEDNVILGYEETKGEAVSLPGVPNSETLDSIPVEAQGKIAYVHSFKMDNPETIAAGTIVNELRPNEEDGTPVLENVRRLTMVTQVDSTEANIETNHLWGILYKSGIETQGASSDMYLRLAKGGYTVDDLNTVADMQTIMGTLDSESGEIVANENWNSHSWNLSSRTKAELETEKGEWTPANLDDATYENDWENTFSPRGFLRGDTIFIGYEYTPSWRVSSVGNLSNNFNVIRSFDNGSTWQDPKDITNISNNQESTLDPRLIPTSEAIMDIEDASPETVFVTYGTVDMDSGIELDLYVTRTIDNGENWDTVEATSPNDDDAVTNEAITQTVAEEKEVQNIASPDGKTLYTVWLQELDPEEAPESAADYLLGSDIWAQRKDYDE